MYPTCSLEMRWNGPTCEATMTSPLSTASKPSPTINVATSSGHRHIVLVGILCLKGNETQFQIRGNTFYCHHIPCHFEHFNIGIDIVHHGQQLIQCRWIKRWHNSMAVLTFVLRIMNLQLCKMWTLSFNRTQGSDFVIKLTLNAKGVGPMLLVTDSST